MLYRKKTLTEAAQWFADGHAKPWAQSAVREMGDHFEIDTREGTLRGEPGDWIARGPQGEVYPIGAEIFAQTYEPADQASAARPATAEDVRLMIREEIRAALAEQRTPEAGAQPMRGGFPLVQHDGGEMLAVDADGRVTWPERLRDARICAHQTFGHSYDPIRPDGKKAYGGPVAV